MKFIVSLFVAVLVACAVPLWFRMSNFGYLGLADPTEEWSHFGSYLDGVISPVLAFLSFLGLLLVFNTRHKKRLALLAGFALLSAHAVAANKEQIMFSKYLKYGFCMEKVFGQPWTEKSKLATVMNQWGTQEPTLSAISEALPGVKARDKQCRLENGIQDEPRPR